MRDFWKSSGFNLLERDGDGHLRVTDDFLRAYYLRPEMHPVEESRAAELALHEELMEAPRMDVAESRLAEIADADARENYRLVLAFRELLLAAGTLEAAYLSIFETPETDGPETDGPETDGNVPAGVPAGIGPPPLFVDQLVHAILRGILDKAEDPLRARAGECLFRAQSVNIVDSAIMAADAETVEMHAASGGFGGLGQLVAESQTPMRSIELDVLSEENAVNYWDRDETHDTVLDLSFSRPGLDALCRVLEAWVEHFLGVRVSIQPVREISDQRWVWHVGLDAEASALLNDLYNGVDIEEGRHERLLSLFRLEFADPAAMRPDIAGRPVYLGMAMNPDKILRIKPQNLLVNLPIGASN
ncbi:MAG: DUF6352 family protein [Alphaproteobacteria bacterium]